MRCECCNDPLNNFESTNKDSGGRYLNTCQKCLDGLGIAQLGSPNHDPDEESDDIEEYFDDPYEENEDDFWE